MNQDRLTDKQQDFAILAIQGYRIVFTPRGEAEGSRAVEYPNERPEAHMKRFSKEIFETEAAALEHAWNDYNATWVDTV